MIAYIVFKTYIVTSITHLEPISQLNQELTNSINYLAGNYTLHLKYNPKDTKIWKNSTKIIHFNHKWTKGPAVNSMLDQLDTLMYGICSPEPNNRKKPIQKRQAMIAAGLVFVYTAAKSIINSLFNPIMNAPQHIRIENHEITLRHIRDSIDNLRRT